MAWNLIGKDFVPPDIRGKVTGRAKYAEDFRADGMLFAKLLSSPMPHARVLRIDASEALAMNGVLGILTADEVADPNDLWVKFWNNGDLRHDYNTSDMEHRVPELVEFATSIMTLSSGDVISCGTNHEGLGPMQDGELAEIEIQGIGRMAFNVSDLLKRSWERGVYMGPGSTAPAARQGSS